MIVVVPAPPPPPVGVPAPPPPLPPVGVDARGGDTLPGGEAPLIGPADLNFAMRDAMALFLLISSSLSFISLATLSRSCCTVSLSAEGGTVILVLRSFLSWRKVLSLFFSCAVIVAVAPCSTSSSLSFRFKNLVISFTDIFAMMVSAPRHSLGLCPKSRVLLQHMLPQEAYAMIKVITLCVGKEILQLCVV